MNHNKRLFIYLLGLLLAAGFLFTSCAKSTSMAPGKTPKCAVGKNLTQEIAAEAEVTEFSCFFKKWDGSETLHYKVTIKNTADTPQRFKVNIFLDNGKAVGGLIPRKTKKGLVKPGATGSFVYPVNDMADIPGEVTLFVKTIAQ
ncbi:MAG: hypothetical protein HOB38_26635 [Deltaproteobacteria bacterium]|nr:hypothetical protein [Deltaproteobacteria bacterium]